MELISFNIPIKKLSAKAKLPSWVLTVNINKCFWICPTYLRNLTPTDSPPVLTER